MATLHGNAKDLSGKRFGKLRAISVVGRSNNNSLLWKCRCDCGAGVEVSSSYLQRGVTQSCGCLQRERSIAAHTTHGKTDSQVWNAYKDIKRRCNNPKHTSYPWYGAQGIRCEFSSFMEFYKTVGDPPHNKMSIDRIDTNGHYAPGNLRWATKEEQMNNRKDNRYVEYQGTRKTIAQWAKVLNLKDKVLRRRILIYKWEVEKAFFTPVKKPIAINL